MKQIKARHKLIPAIIMLLVAAITMSTASYAWFTMSTKVEVSGIDLAVVAPANILIREKLSTPVVFSSAAVITAASNPTGKLNHVSSLEGVNFFTIDDATAAGVNPTTGALPANPTISDVSNQPVTTSPGYYYDYKLELVNTGNAQVQIGVRNVVVSPKVGSNPADVGIAKAVRFAVLNAAGTAVINAAAPVFSDDQVTLAALTGTGGTTQSVTSDDKYQNNLFTLSAGGIADKDNPSGHLEVTIRVWIEGQDLNCKTANANSAFTVQFEFYIYTP